MSTPEPSEMPEGQLMREAADWFARMRGPDAEASRPEFEAWLSRGALHRAAYNRAADIFAMGRLLAEPEPVGANTERSLPKSSRLVLAAALGAFLALVAVGWVIARGNQGLRPAGLPAIVGGKDGGRYASPASEDRTIRLSDGSVIRLAGDSKFTVHFGADGRRIELERGRARFEVSHEARPFIVSAGGGTITARGTIFDVALETGGGVTVGLIEGAVDVALPATGSSPGARPRVRRLAPGETISYSAARPGDAAAPNSSSLYAGAVAGTASDFDAVRIIDLIEVANRGSIRPIRLTDNAIGDRRVSGRFRIDDTHVLARRLASLFGLALDLSDPGRIVLRPR